MEIRSYYLSSYRSTIIGVILIIVGFAILFIGFDANLSLVENFQNMVIDFESVWAFAVSILLLPFKLVFVLIGCFLIKNRKKVIRAKIDDKGFYFKEITRGNKFEMLAFDNKALTFLPYSKITDIQLKNSFWRGYYLEIEIGSERKKLTALDVLSKSEKMEIFDIVKRRINKNR